MKTSTPHDRRPVVAVKAAIPAPTVEVSTDLQCTDRAVREQILHRAYAIWESEGHPGDRKLANWLEAEVAVLGHA